MKELNRSKQGQILVIFVVALIGLLAFLALIIDGGTLFTNRRAAQNAADAGAMAGAAEKCIPDDYDPWTSPSQAAGSFVASNGAIMSGFGETTYGVTVTTQISATSYFAHLIGFPELTAQASAAANCCSPTSGVKVMPIGWFCEAAEDEVGTPTYCEGERFTLDEIEDKLENPPADGTLPDGLMILMDPLGHDETTEENNWCISDGGELPCDLDGDGLDDYSPSGARSWLDLNGVQGGVPDLEDWIDNGYPEEIIRGTWVPAQTGLAADIFNTAANHVDEIFAIPVFDRYCDGEPSSNCPELVDETDIILSEVGSMQYRLVGFAAFYISCVYKTNLSVECPANALFQEVIADKEFSFPMQAKPPTIEGYFVKGILPNIGGGDCENGIDTGAYVLFLSE